MASAPSSKNQTRGPVLVGTAFVVVLCLLWCGVTLAFQSAASRGRVGIGYSVEVCIGLTRPPRVRLGVTWISPYLSSLPPVPLSNPVCTFVPWLPAVPLRGGFTIP
jgi:hypothetical protein